MIVGCNVASHHTAIPLYANSVRNFNYQLINSFLRRHTNMTKMRINERFYFCVHGLLHKSIVTAALLFCMGPATAATADIEQPDLKFGFIKLTDMAPLAIAYEKGFFEDEGLYVTLEAQANWKVLLDREIDGELDGAHMLSGQPIGATIGFGTKADVVTAFTMDLNGNAITVSNAVWEDMKKHVPMEGGKRPALGTPAAADARPPGSRHHPRLQRRRAVEPGCRVQGHRRAGSGRLRDPQEHVGEGLRRVQELGRSQPGNPQARGQGADPRLPVAGRGQQRQPPGSGGDPFPPRVRGGRCQGDCQLDDWHLRVREG